MTSTSTVESRQAPPTGPPALTPLELARWAWRQLTSMRTALVLLFLLALAAVPGSIVPQSDIDSIAVSRWQDGAEEVTGHARFSFPEQGRQGGIEATRKPRR
jgi:cytochrome c biogenesis protein